MTGKIIEPGKALDDFFQIVKQEALANPAFGRRLIEAIGYKVIYRGSEAMAAIDPVLVAIEGLEPFRATFASMKVAEVKKIGEAAGLFQRGEKLPKGLGEQIDLLWQRAQQRLRDLSPNARHAAE